MFNEFITRSESISSEIWSKIGFYENAFPNIAKLLQLNISGY